MREQAQAVVHIDDGRFRVTEWRFAPGAETGWHRHGHDYVVVPLTDGTLRLDEPGGATREAPLALHVPYARRTGVEHNVINAGDAPLAFLELEVVDDAGTAARLRVLELFEAARAARDVDAMMACMAEDCTLEAEGAPGTEGARHEGRAAVRQALAATLDAFPAAERTSVGHMVGGDLGVSRWQVRGTDADGGRHALEGCDLVTFAGERIARVSSFRRPVGG